MHGELDALSDVFALCGRGVSVASHAVSGSVVLHVVSPTAPEEFVRVTGHTATGYPVLKWAWFFFSREKLQLLRKIAYVRVINDAAAV